MLNDTQAPQEGPATDPQAPQGGEPNLMSLYGQSLEENAAIGQLYENPVMDNPAAFDDFGAEAQYEPYDPYEGPLSGRAQGGPEAVADSRTANKDKLASVLALKAQERKANSLAFQSNAQNLNKQGAGSGGSY